MNAHHGTGLQTIFGFFLGLMVTSFVGVGVYTFYPSPERDFRDRVVALNRQQEEIRISKASDALTPQDRSNMQRIQNELNETQDAMRYASERWGRRTSVILIALATVAMAVSLVRALQLPVISNGLLLGGLFTMVYGVGWIIATDSSTIRFFVLAAALGITIGLGYLRFVRPPVQPPTQGFAVVPGAEGLSELERRVRTLEDRMASGARALGYERDRSSEER